jgi:NAD(P)-dependent dehydrogenase (short-subunit alcohol dehydrogenase family)
MDLGLDGNVAVLTASSSGLGKASAEALVAEGVDVVINGRDEQRLESARETVAAAGDGRVVAVQADITDPDAPGELVEAAVDEFGRLDHVVTSAGGPAPGSFLDTTDEDWYEAFDLLVMSVVRLVRAAAPHLREAEGSVVTITSQSVKEALDQLVLSNAVRMSVIGLEKTLSKELAPEVRANAVLPGSHETARMEELIGDMVDRGDVDSYEEGAAQWGESIPADRMGQPRELGDVVAFLCSDRASYLSGAAVPVDGGASASNL